MYYISRLRFKGFKSFKSTEVTLPNGFVALAGPNGSGKSNVMDAIRFAFGEMALRSLRVDRVAKLINERSNSAEVTIHIEGDKRFEIKRTIHEDGHTSYELDGRDITRTAVLEALRPYGLEVGPQNVIAQGQVQRIADMNSRERRGIIDNVAGISEFEDKKKEAMNELGRVEARIGEARIVLSERGAYLAELEKERDAALAHMEAKKMLERGRATLVDAEYRKLEAHFEEILKKRKAIAEEMKTLAAQLSELEAQKKDLSEKVRQIGERIGKSGERDKLMAGIEGLKVSQAQRQTLMEEKAKGRTELEEENKECEGRITRTRAAIGGMQGEHDQLHKEWEQSKKQLEDLRKKAGLDEGADAGRKELDALAEGLAQAAQAKAGLEGQKGQLEALMGSERETAQRLEADIAKLEGAGEDKRLGTLAGQIGALTTRLDTLFDEERKINKSNPDLDRQLLEAKERVAALRGSVSPAAQNPALLQVNTLKASGWEGIFGTVAELTQVDEEYRPAVEAAGASRLTYVVVDTLDNATRIIAKLKEQKAGRCSFIPLDKIQMGNARDGPAPAGSLGRLINFVRYDARVDKAMRFCFEDTILVSSVDAAKKVGVGQHRLVTMGGELLERSGVITGGAARGSLMARQSLAKAEADVEEVKARRDAQYARLYELRDEMGKLRRDRADAELKLRTLEAESGSAGRLGRVQALREQKKAAEAELAKRQEQASDMEGRISKLGKQVAELEAKLASARSKAEAAALAAKAKYGQAQEKYQTAVEAHSALEGRLGSKRTELEMVRAQLGEAEKERAEGKSRLAALEKDLKFLEGEHAAERERLDALEKQLTEVSKSVQKQYEQMQQLQAQLDGVGKEAGAAQYKLDRKGTENNSLEVNLQVTQSRLADIKAEWEKNKGIELLDAPKDEVEAIVKQAEAKLASLGSSINLKAPEMYEQRKKELDEVRGRVETLESERGAVLALMEGIEQKKRSIFLDTFKAVNEHFQKLFGMVYRGEGSLVLQDPSNPLESGLEIRVRGEKDKRDKYLESMSGGEKTLLGLMFIFALQMRKAAPFYILDEVEAALDKDNAARMSEFVRQMSKTAQFLVITHNDAMLTGADVVLGVSRIEGVSHIVGVQLSSGSRFVQSKDKGADLAAAIAAEAATEPGRPGEAVPGASIPKPGEQGVSGLANPAKEMEEVKVAPKKERKGKA